MQRASAPMPRCVALRLMPHGFSPEPVQASTHTSIPGPCCHQPRLPIRFFPFSVTRRLSNSDGMGAHSDVPSFDSKLRVGELARGDVANAAVVVS